MKRRIILSTLFLIAVLGGWRLYTSRISTRGLEPLWPLVSPGELSKKHENLSTDCAACHSPVHGVQSANCIQCHATDSALLQRQPTAFHASVKDCSGCHFEHQGRDNRLTNMDHSKLVHVGLKELLKNETTVPGGSTTSLIQLIRNQTGRMNLTPAPHAEISPAEAMLNCATCHSNQDKHFKLFGEDCSQCHGVSSWKIGGYKHPSSESRDCSQCHQAPPSHYMEHFEMVSKRVAQQGADPNSGCCASAQVSQCYLCHKTTSWNDIRGIGWYKHH